MTLTVQFQVRAWNNDNGNLSTWAAALASGTAEMGYSDIFTVKPGVAPFETPPLLYGLTSFNLTIVPEPKVTTLGLLGIILATAVWRGRWHGTKSSKS